MHRTYELYGRRHKDRGVLRMVTCHESEIIAHAQDMLDREEVDEVEVRQGGRALFTLVK